MTTNPHSLLPSFHDHNHDDHHHGVRMESVSRNSPNAARLMGDERSIGMGHDQSNIQSSVSSHRGDVSISTMKTSNPTSATMPLRAIAGPQWGKLPAVVTATNTTATTNTTTTTTPNTMSTTNDRYWTPGHTTTSIESSRNSSNGSPRSNRATHHTHAHTHTTNRRHATVTSATSATGVTATPAIVITEPDGHITSANSHGHGHIPMNVLSLPSSISATPSPRQTGASSYRKYQPSIDFGMNRNLSEGAAAATAAIMGEAMTAAAAASASAIGRQSSSTLQLSSLSSSSGADHPSLLSIVHQAESSRHDPYVPYTPLYNAPLINPDDYTMLLNPSPSPPPSLPARTASISATDTNLSSTSDNPLVPSSTSTSHVVITGTSTGDDSSVPSARLHTTTTYNLAGDHHSHIAITVDDRSTHNTNSNGNGNGNGTGGMVINNDDASLNSPLRRVRPSARGTAGGTIFPPVAGAISLSTSTRQPLSSSSSSAESRSTSSGHTHVGDNTFVTGIDLGAPLQEIDEKEDSVLTVEAAMRNLPSTLEYQTTSLPDSVDIMEIMEVATLALPLQHAFASHTRIWRHYFHKKHECKKIIQDSFWWCMCFFFGRPVTHSPLRTTHRPLAAMNHSLSDPTLAALMSPSSSSTSGNGNGHGLSHTSDTTINALSQTLPSMSPNQSHPPLSSSLAADPLSLTLRSSSSSSNTNTRVHSSDTPPTSVVPWTIADRTSQAAKRAARSAAFPLRYTSSYIDQNATEKDNPLSSLMHAIKLRVAHQFVSLFSRTKAVHKDIVLSYLYDALAQTMYYAMQVSYPGSRVELDTSIFKHDLIKLFARWTLGHIPAAISAAHWKILLREQKELVMEQAPIAQNAITSVAQLEDKLKQARATRARRAAHGHGTHARQSRVATTTTTTTVGGDKNDSFSPSNDTNSYNTNSNNSNNNMNAGSTSPPILSSSSTSGRHGHAALGVALLAKTRNASRRASLPMSPTRAFESLAGDEVRSVAASEITRVSLAPSYSRLRRDRAILPTKVVRNTTVVHHCELVQFYIDHYNMTSQTNHSVRLPITTPEIVESPIDHFLDKMRTVNAEHEAKTRALTDQLVTIKAQFNNLVSKLSKRYNEKSRKLDSDKGIAQREASVFAKTLVAEYQTKKYSELKEPSKSLALRRLGHYRSYKEEQMAGSVFLRESESALLARVKSYKA